MRRRTLEEKLEAIRLVEEGNSPRSVSDRLHIGHHQIYEWLYIYKEKGASGLENKRICRKNQFSFEKKCEIIREYQNEQGTDSVHFSPVLYRRHSNRLTVFNQSNFLGSLQVL